MIGGTSNMFGGVERIVTFRQSVLVLPQCMGRDGVLGDGLHPDSKPEVLSTTANIKET